MSIVACVKVYDGLVLGAESMTQLTTSVAGQPQPQPQLVKSYEHAQKIFEVRKDPGVGLLTYGIGNIGRRSIESFVREFNRAENRNEMTVEQIAAQFLQFMNQHYAPAFGQLPADARPAMGFVIAGYSASHHLGDVWEFVLPQDQAPRRAVLQDTVGASWRGVGFPFTRLMFGVDPRFQQLLQQQGATPQELQRFQTVVNMAATPIAFDGMPLQDAIGYCRFIIQTTIGWCTYAIGAAACGGPIKLAVITPSSGWEWITPIKPYMEGERHV